MNHLPSFLQVFRDQTVTKEDIRSDAKAIMLSDGARFAKADLGESVITDNVHLVVLCKSYKGSVAYECSSVGSVTVMVHESDYPTGRNNSRMYTSSPDETDCEILIRLFREHLPNLARELLPPKIDHSTYFNAIKRSIRKHVQKRTIEAIDIINNEEEFVLGKKLPLVSFITSEEDAMALREGFSQTFPEDHMTIERDGDCYDIVLTVRYNVTLE